MVSDQITTVKPTFRFITCCASSLPPPPRTGRQSCTWFRNGDEPPALGGCRSVRVQLMEKQAGLFSPAPQRTAASPRPRGPPARASGATDQRSGGAAHTSICGTEQQIAAPSRAGCRPQQQLPLVTTNAVVSHWDHFHQPASLLFRSKEFLWQICPYLLNVNAHRLGYYIV